MQGGTKCRASASHVSTQGAAGVRGRPGPGLSKSVHCSCRHSLPQGTGPRRDGVRGQGDCPKGREAVAAPGAPGASLGGPLLSWGDLQGTSTHPCWHIRQGSSWEGFLEEAS